MKSQPTPPPPPIKLLPHVAGGLGADGIKALLALACAPNPSKPPATKKS